MKSNTSSFIPLLKKSLPYLICFLFLVAYLTLSLVKHQHYLTGYDLGVEDQAVWDYSQFKNPISTSHAYTFTPVYFDHVEIIYALISPFYWIWNDVRMLIILYVFAIVISAVPVYLLAKEKKLPEHLSLILLITYLAFYGIQNAIWFDVHSIGFGVCFLAWFLYFLYKGNMKYSIIFFILAIFSKEDMALLTCLISLVFYFLERKKYALSFTAASLLYLGIIFGVYFPHFVPGGYRFQNHHGLLADTNPLYLINTPDKRSVILYALSSFGFLPLLSPIALLPFLGDLAHFFIIGNSSVTSAQGLFGHYRITLSLLLIWPTILTLAKYKKINSILFSLYLCFWIMFVQYALHLPLSYLAKSWFWHTPPGALSIERMKKIIPPNASLVTQNNITPHFSHRDNIFTLWPDKRMFSANSPCGQQTCNWFRWAGKPTLLLIDTSQDWDIRHFLANREDYLKGIQNLEKTGVIKRLKQDNTTTLYKIMKDPKKSLI